MRMGGIQVADALARPPKDKLAVIPKVSDQARYTFPVLLAAQLLSVSGIYRRPPRPPRHNLQVAFIQQNGDGVNVSRVGLEAQSSCFQGNGAAPRKRV